MAFDVDLLRPIGVNASAGSTIWYYSTLVDTLSTIFGTGYFNTANSSMLVPDIIIIRGTDGVSLASVASIDGSNDVTLDLFDEFTIPDADEIPVNDTSSLDAGGTVPSAGSSILTFLEYLTTRRNLCVVGGSSVGTGNTILNGTDDTDPTSRRIEFRRITGENNEEHIDVITNGETIEIAAKETLIRQAITSTTGVSIIRNANTGGEIDLRGFTSDTGGIDIALEGADVDFNAASDLVQAGTGISVSVSGGKFTVTNQNP